MRSMKSTHSFLSILGSTAFCIAVALPILCVANPYEYAREQMVREIENDVRETAFYIGKKSFDERVMDAMAKVPRHAFVPNSERDQAYVNRPLPIGYGQTISQPYIVALMTDLLDIQPGDTVLEVGTGSGYQAAVLAELTPNVFSIEIIEALSQRARQVLKQQGYENVKTRLGDGYYGWQEHAPFDGIVVTAASSHIPPPLVQQLKRGGRMIIPVGSRFMTQYLILVEKDQQDKIHTRQILPVRFVPLVGDHD